MELQQQAELEGEERLRVRHSGEVKEGEASEQKKNKENTGQAGLLYHLLGEECLVV